MATNWRSSLVLSKLSFQGSITDTSHDIYKPVEYIALDGSKLKTSSTLQWVKENFGSIGFDFDPHTLLLWSMDDTIPQQEVVSRINTISPKFASIKLVSPALAHGLDEEASLTFFESTQDELPDNSDINLIF